MTAETKPTASETLPAKLEATYHPMDSEKTYVDICGDDRKLDPAKAGELRTALLTRVPAEKLADPLAEGYLRVFGGMSGITKIKAIATVAQYGPEALKAFPEFEDFMEDTTTRVEANSNIVLALHEGCAAANIGAVSDVSVNNPAVQQTAEQEFMRYLKPHMDIPHETIVAGERAAAEHFFGEDASQWAAHKVDPLAKKEEGVPVATLEGEHAQPEETIMVLNMIPGTVSNPAEAIEAWGQAYNFDIADTARRIMESEPDLKLNPDILVATMFHMATAVRGALCGGDPNRMKMVVRGDVGEALAYLRAIATQQN